jgi:hypothetical protein
MIISTGTKKMFEVWYERAHGFNPKNESASRESDKRVAEIREAAEREAAIHEAASIQEKENTIYNLYSNGVSISIIAIAMGVTEVFVAEVIAKRK